ncbi:flagellar basal body protein [Clostridia bacterium]|nr:flagellar basal body protein [Clostridia bacterium]
MMRSLFAGVSGLKNHQTKMDVIGNNIANVNTQGFKASRTSFAEMYNQTLSAASAPTGTLGGINPKQIGLGVSTRAIDVLFTQGATQTTGRTLDLAIQGDGFISVFEGDLDGEHKDFYTRAGNLYLDENGYLLTAGGQFVKGVNLLGAEALGDEATDAWPPIGVREADGDASTTVLAPDQKPFTVTEDGELENPGLLGRLAVPMNFTNISISVGGVISGISPTGDLLNIGLIPLVNFVNAPGLERVGENMYVESTNSGSPQFGRPALDSGAGKLTPGALEMSNVDLSQEFTDMIITQRGFQANARIITVSDTLLEELINLKR